MSRMFRACVLVVAAAACACTPGLYSRDVTAVVSGPTTVAVGGTVQLNVRLSYSDGGSQLIGPSNAASIEWTSSNTAIATVLRGTVTGVSPGAVTITATPATGTVGSGERVPGTHQMSVQ